MDLLETLAHTFITKLWVEETAEESGQTLWRGHITHVPSGRKQPIKELDDITSETENTLNVAANERNQSLQSTASRLSTPVH